MKNYTLIISLLVTSMSYAQNLTTFGLAGNTDNLIHNPGADPLTSFHIKYAGFNTSLAMNHTASDIFANPDLLASLSSLSESLNVGGETSVNLMNIGIKAGKNFIFAGYSQHISYGFSFDPDLAQFAKYGFGDGNGNVNLNYSGDFSDVGTSLDVTNDIFVGLQRSFWDNKLRIGVSAHQIGYGLGLRLNTDVFSVISTPTAIPGRNNLNVNYDFTVATINLLDASSTMDELSDLGKALPAPEALITNITTPSNSTTSFSFGASFEPIEKLSLQFSINGLGASPITISTDVAKRLSGGVAVDGFEYVSNATDTLATAVRNEVQSYVDDIFGGINTNLENTTFSYEYVVPQITNVALNYHLKGETYVGVHYTNRMNSSMDFEYLGFTSLLWLHKNLQLKGAYYLTMDESNTDLITTALQLRVTPLLQIYIGTTTTSDIATILANSGETIMVGSDTRGLNFTAGASMIFFDKRFKKDKKDKAEKKGKEATLLSPEDVKKVDDAHSNSDTVKKNK